MKFSKLKIQRGFTLIEILIVLVVTSILLLFLISLYFQVTSITSNQSDVSQMHQRISYVMKTIKQDLNNLVADKWNDTGSNNNVKNIFLSKKNPDSSRRSDAISFLSSRLYTNTMMLSSQVFNVTYFCKHNKEKDIFTLYKRENIFAEYNTEEPFGGLSIPIIENVYSFYFEFSRDGENWEYEEWDHNEDGGYPPYIAVNIEYKLSENQTYKFREVIHPPILWL